MEMRVQCEQRNLLQPQKRALAFLWGLAVLCLSLCWSQAQTELESLGESLGHIQSAQTNSFYKSFTRESDPGSYLVYKESYGRAGPIVLNHQSALWEQVVLAVNNTDTRWEAVKLTVSNVKGGRVYNALHEGEGRYELLHNYPVEAQGGMVKFVVEYRMNDNEREWKEEPTFIFQPTVAEERKVSTLHSRPVRTTLEVQPLGVGYYSVDLPDLVDVATPSGWNLPLSPYEMGGWSSVGVTLSFDAIPDKVYEIQFSDDGKNWLPTLPQVRAASSLVFWVDKGVPKTPSHPMLTIVPGGIPAPVRLYRVVELQ